MSDKTSHPLAKKILKLRGKKSYGLIAEELGVSRNVVAGVIFRSDWPKEKRVDCPTSPGRNNCSGTGRIAGAYPMEHIAPKHMPFLGRPGPRTEIEA